MGHHFREKQGTQSEKLCVCCGLGFNVTGKCCNHLTEKHGLLPCKSRARKTKPVSSASDRALREFNISGSDKHDFLQFMTDTKPRIDQLLAKKFLKTCRKLQKVLKVEVLKPTKGSIRNNDAISNDTLCSTSLPHAEFFNAVDEMTNTLFT